MMNPIVNQMMGSMFGNNPFINLFRMVKAANNPATAMQSAMQSNPQLSEVMKYINQNGGNAKQLYYNLCKQRNTDPNIIINQLNNQL